MVTAKEEISNNVKFLIAAFALIAIGACGTSQPPPPQPAEIAPAPETTPTSQAPGNSPSKHVAVSPEASSKRNITAVLSRIHKANLIQIELANTARERASTDAVRSYADQLVRDHTSLDEAVFAMAKKSGNHAALRRLTRETGQVTGVKPKLASAQGPNFDKLFLEQASTDHDRLIRQLQQDREDASDEELEALIDKVIPILEQDRELAQILMKKEQA